MVQHVLLDEIDSTSVEFLKRLENAYDLDEVDGFFETLDTGDYLATWHQTHGRGRYDRTWVDEPGQSALLSVFVRDFTPWDVPRVALAVSACLMSEFDIECSVKWPNDVLVNGKKIAGILGARVEHFGNDAIIGIGINVDQPASALEEFGASSVRCETEEEFDAIDLNDDIAEAIVEFRKFSDKEIREMIELVLSRHYGSEPLTASVSEDEKLTGTYAGLGDNYELILETADGERFVTAGDVS